MVNSAAVTGCCAAQAGEVLDLDVALALAAEVRHHGEGADVHEGVGRQVEHGRRDADLGVAR